MCSQPHPPVGQTSTSSFAPQLPILFPSSTAFCVTMWSNENPPTTAASTSAALSAAVAAETTLSAKSAPSAPPSPISSSTSTTSSSCSIPFYELAPTADYLLLPLRQRCCDTPSGHFAALVSLLLMSLESADDPANFKLRVQAKALVKECVRRNAMGDPHFSPLQTSMSERLRGLVGEARWAQAHCHLRIYIGRHHQTHSNSSSTQSRDDDEGGQVHANLTGKPSSVLKRTGSHLSSAPLPFENMLPLVKKESYATTASARTTTKSSTVSTSGKQPCKRRRVTVDATQEAR